ncbi:hypothetical protein UY3_15913 [Chelonia mydas]|uniref:Uncharacterized protein n=1 Tax=Chelonia mydas TaxID=8469 RepID=M7AVF3_CHEMY|nr:hypothetical protein UY3_15913 [Chelonia mydas]
MGTMRSGEIQTVIGGAIVESSTGRSIGSEMLDFASVESGHRSATTTGAVPGNGDVPESDATMESGFANSVAERCGAAARIGVGSSGATGSQTDVGLRLRGERPQECDHDRCRAGEWCRARERCHDGEWFREPCRGEVRCCCADRCRFERCHGVSDFDLDLKQDQDLSANDHREWERLRGLGL